MTTMNAQKNLTHQTSVAKKMLQGAGIAFVLIALFLISAGEGKPEWGKFWMIKPLLMVPIAGAMGGLFYHLMDRLFNDGSWKRILAILFGFIGYLVAIWMGTVLGLNGTMWD